MTARFGLAALLGSQPTAALGTLHKGEPFVSMVPYALVPGLNAFAIHVSALASHTKDMIESPAVSLMVTALARPGELPQGLARATFQCGAQRWARDDPHYEAARKSYLLRGFAQAATVTMPELEGVLAQASAGTP